jgi:YrbI family 3-deoxy-D-manno-octulosonate 8-phosphate phosphatase
LRILIIPARGGSKGIPKKNLRTVNGISLIERALRSSLKSKVDQVIVSTDDKEISEIAIKYGATLHNRSAENSGDSAFTESVILEVIDNFESQWPSGSVVGFIQATSPFISSKTVNECFELAEQGYSSFSAKNFHGFVWEKIEKWTPVNHPLEYRPRRQELNQKVVETGAIYCFPLQQFKEKKYRFCSEPKPVLVDTTTGIEIDEISELELANLLATQYERSDFEFMNIKLPKIIFTDFDGCLTDDKVKVNIFGKESVKANRKDGLAVKRLEKLGIKVVITTSETNEVVATRAQKMGIEALRGLSNKMESISTYLEKALLKWDEAWYLGNDVNDLESMQKVAVSFCPLDASVEVFKIADVVLSRRGGEGVLAEIASRVESVNK